MIAISTFSGLLDISLSLIMIFHDLLSPINLTNNCPGSSLQAYLSRNRYLCTEDIGYRYIVERVILWFVYFFSLPNVRISKLIWTINTIQYPYTYSLLALSD